MSETVKRAMILILGVALGAQFTSVDELFEGLCPAAYRAAFAEWMPLSIITLIGGATCGLVAAFLLIKPRVTIGKDEGK